MRLLMMMMILSGLAFPGTGRFSLTVSVTGLQPPEGDLYIGLHQRPAYFHLPDSAFMKVKVAVKGESGKAEFNNVPAGTYALAVYHDQNLNGILDVNEKGIPKEGYGFSTKTKAVGKPKFEQARFELSGNDTVEVRMIYLGSKEKQQE